MTPCDPNGDRTDFRTGMSLLIKNASEHPRQIEIYFNGVSAERWTIFSAETDPNGEIAPAGLLLGPYIEDRGAIEIRYPTGAEGLSVAAVALAASRPEPK